MAEHPANARQRQWREEFIERICLLTKAEADRHQVADWAIEAQQKSGDRDPLVVAEEEFEKTCPESGK